LGSLSGENFFLPSSQINEISFLEIKSKIQDLFNYENSMKKLSLENF